MKLNTKILKGLNEAVNSKETEIPSNWKKNSDGSYDVNGDVNIFQIRQFIKGGRLTIKFNKVSGYFECPNSKLTSLEGCPKEVGGSFRCEYNKLTSLKGVPERIKKSFDCRRNQLTSLEGAPKEVGWDFNCSDNPGKFTEDDARTVCKAAKYIC